MNVIDRHPHVPTNASTLRAGTSVNALLARASCLAERVTVRKLP